jgi:hypothetical protein
MKKIILTSVATVISLVIAVKIGLFNALFMLFLAGVIPGTQIIIPANIMLLMISTVMCGILFYSTAKELMRAIIKHHTIVPKRSRTPHLPKRRFSEV